MAKYFEKSASRALVSGLQTGEFAITYDRNGNEILAVSIAKEDRKSGLINFTAMVSGKERIEDDMLIETGFYPVKKGGKTRLSFIAYGEARYVPSVYAKEVRLSGELIDLDQVEFIRNMRKAADHLAAENRKLMKEVKDLRKAFEEEREERKLHEEIKGFDPAAKPAKPTSSKPKADDDDDEDLYI